MSDGGKGSVRRPKQITQEEADNNWERVFGKKKPLQEWDEDRIDIIGQNGNVGYDLDQAYQQVEKDYNEGN